MGGDAPLLGDREGVPGDADVVIGGKQGDQAEGEAANRLGDTEAIQPEGAEASLGERGVRCVWRKRRGFAAGRRHLGGQTPLHQCHPLSHLLRRMGCDARPMAFGQVMSSSSLGLSPSLPSQQNTPAGILSGPP